MVQVGEVGNRTDGDKNWEFAKRSKHFSFGDHFINSHNFFPWFCMDIVFDIGHSWDLKGYMNVRVSVAWIRLLLTVTWQSVCELCIFSCDLSSLHICCRITTNLFIKGIHDLAKICSKAWWCGKIAKNSGIGRVQTCSRYVLIICVVRIVDWA